MSGFGQIYVEVSADVVNGGIMVASAGGTVGGGEGAEHGTWWLHWSYDVAVDGTVTGGYSGKNWYWDDPNNGLAAGWAMSSEATQYGTGFEGFIKYLSNNPNLNSLDQFLLAWDDSDMKTDFVNTHLADLGSYAQGGCIELR